VGSICFFRGQQQKLRENPTHDCEGVSGRTRGNPVCPRTTRCGFSRACIAALQDWEPKGRLPPAVSDNGAEEVRVQDEDASPVEGKATKARTLDNPASRRSARAK